MTLVTDGAGFIGPAYRPRADRDGPDGIGVEMGFFRARSDLCNISRT
jgi:hypothetical protein